MKEKTKKPGTGEWLGQRLLERAAACFTEEGRAKAARNDPEELKAMETLTAKERAIYDKYLLLLAWINSVKNKAWMYYMRAQLASNNILQMANDAITGELLNDFSHRMPAIMGSDEFIEARKQGISTYCTKDGVDIKQSTYDLIIEGIEFYLAALVDNPGAPNPLKAIQQQYEKAQVKSSYILDNWHRANTHGYCVLASGIRGEIMTREEFNRYVVAQEEGELYDIIKNYLEGGNTNYEQNLKKDPQSITGATWLEATGRPARLTKWQALQSVDKLYKDGDNLKDLLDELPEAIEAIEGDIKAKYKIDLAGVPVERWRGPYISRRQLYRLNFYRQRKKADTQYLITEESGVAVIQDRLNIAPGAYDKPKRGLYREQTMEGYIEECGASRRDKIIEETGALIVGYSYMAGYNCIVELIAQAHKVPSFTAFSIGCNKILEQLKAIQVVVELLGSIIHSLPDTDTLRVKKLRAFKDYFLPPRLDKAAISPEDREKAYKLIKSLTGFTRGAYPEELTALLLKE